MFEGSMTAFQVLQSTTGNKSVVAVIDSFTSLSRLIPRSILRLSLIINLLLIIILGILLLGSLIIIG